MNDDNEVESTTTLFVCGTSPCSHVWDGPSIETENSSSATCSKCGNDAMSVALWEGP